MEHSGYELFEEQVALLDTKAAPPPQKDGSQDHESKYDSESSQDELELQQLRDNFFTPEPVHSSSTDVVEQSTSELVQHVFVAHPKGGNLTRYHVVFPPRHCSLQQAWRRSVGRDIYDPEERFQAWCKHFRPSFAPLSLEHMKKKEWERVDRYLVTSKTRRCLVFKCTVAQWKQLFSSRASIAKLEAKLGRLVSEKAAKLRATMPCDDADTDHANSVICEKRTDNLDVPELSESRPLSEGTSPERNSPRSTPSLLPVWHAIQNLPTTRC
mmetsp:Transcript_35831/g.70391  ORF Transcript_35831/g.70391 Transcript_35831/m.70391 type:complete len:269 (-) Transcript_35831:81-887(-)